MRRAGRMTQKKKILLLSDHALSTSGVGTQSRYLCMGLINTGKWTIRQFGAAVKHESYETVQAHEDLIIKPVDGFGTREMLRLALASEKPDVLLLFTDPRFFIWVWEMEDEIHQVCPIAYNHLWDSCKFPPTYNKVLFDSTDLLNCINYPTYEFLKQHYPEKTNFIPHSLPREIFYPLPEQEQLLCRRALLRGRPDDTFVVLWVARNARRKQPGDVLWAWRMFLDKLQETHGHQKALLVMHTDPHDVEGPNLNHIIELFKLEKNVTFSNDKSSFNDMNKLYNASDTILTRSSAEGFGLPTLEAMYAGKPIIALKTGGLTRQVVDHRDGSENGVALPVELESLVGSQMVPYIVDDYVTNETVAKAILKMYDFGPERRRELGLKAMKYAHDEFGIEKMIKSWDDSLTELTQNWRSRHRSWESIKL